MKKTDCEIAIRQLAHEWASTQERTHDWHPSFFDFKTWLDSRGLGRYMEFRSVMGPTDDAERWFDQELRQQWRN